MAKDGKSSIIKVRNNLGSKSVDLKSSMIFQEVINNPISVWATIQLLWWNLFGKTAYYMLALKTHELAYIEQL